ncbi:DUF4240 domain-containing protein, partial [Acetobacter lovaniensis]|uniref:DUF4240 domain-containing protein n=1 Tax=Acetobacter lovaniensis TaxID=104100 RepID=UPI00376FFCBC
DLWAVAYAARGGCGDDAFDYFCAWLVHQGRDTYEAAMANPVQWALQFPFDDDPQCEDVLSVAANAWRTRTGEDMPLRRGKRRSGMSSP